jgi:hypothetical protein
MASANNHVGPKAKASTANNVGRSFMRSDPFDFTMQSARRASGGGRIQQLLMYLRQSRAKNASRRLAAKSFRPAISLGCFYGHLKEFPPFRGPEAKHILGLDADPLRRRHVHSQNF